MRAPEPVCRPLGQPRTVATESSSEALSTTTIGHWWCRAVAAPRREFVAAIAAGDHERGARLRGHDRWLYPEAPAKRVSRSTAGYRRWCPALKHPGYRRSGFVGGHLCEALLDRGATRSSASTTCRPVRTTRTSGCRTGRVPVRPADINEPLPCRARDLRHGVPSRLPGFARRLPAAADARHCAPAPTGRPSRWTSPGGAGRASCSPRPARSTETPWSIRRRETYWGNVNPIGPRSVYDEAKRFAEALTFAYRVTAHLTSGWHASSTPTDRACVRTTAGWCRRSAADVGRRADHRHGRRAPDALAVLRRRHRGRI